MVDLARERRMIDRRGYDWYTHNLGETVIWFEYDAVESEYHPVYDEDSVGGTRRWRPGILVPVLWANKTEGDRVVTPEGRQVIPTLRLAVPVSQLRRVGLSSPMDAARHLNDVLVYGRTQWLVESYQLRGRLRDSVVVGVNCVKIFPEDEMSLGVPPDYVGLASTQRPRGFPSDAPPQEWPEHVLPALGGGAPPDPDD